MRRHPSRSLPNERLATSPRSVAVVRLRSRVGGRRKDPKQLADASLRSWDFVSANPAPDLARILSKVSAACVARRGGADSGPTRAQASGRADL